MQTEDKKQLAERMVRNFINNFHETFGVKPKVVYKVDYSIPTLNQIYDLVNEEFQNACPGHNLDEKNRTANFIKYRGIYYSICTYFKYSLHSMCRLTDQNHATALNALKQIKENSPLKTKILQQLQTKI